MSAFWKRFFNVILSAAVILNSHGLALATVSLAPANQPMPPTPAAPSEPILPYSYLTGPSLDAPLAIASAYLRDHYADHGLYISDVGNWRVSDQYTSQHNGVTHIYLQQELDGVPVFNGIFNLNIDRQGRVLVVGNRFAADLAGTANTRTPTLAASRAVEAAAAFNNLMFTEALVQKSALTSGTRKTVFNGAGVALGNITAELVYDTSGKTPRLAWNVILQTLDAKHWWNTRVDAATGQVLSQNDWVIREDFEEQARQAGTLTGNLAAPSVSNGPSAVSPLSVTPPTTVTDGSSYRVYQIPVESPSHSTPATPADGRVVIANFADTLASPFGWHDTNGAAGAESTLTLGNNVQAYLDLGNDNSATIPGDFPADGGAGLDFLFGLDLTQAPSAYRPAAVTNLFFWNNLMHNVYYRYGFNEVAGNFQVNNYGRGGTGNDRVNAEAQDGGGNNNANFATPADGSPPRMQMYLWNTTTPGRDGDFDNGIIAHEYGHGISNRLTGGPSNVSCLGNTEQMGEGWSDWNSLFMTFSASENFATGRGIGTYALGQATNGVGIRPARYATSLAVNNYTYANLNDAGISVPHGVGFIWNTMLYEMTAALVQRYGLNPNPYGAWNTGGNNLANQLIVDGMKIQPCSPGFVDGRNAILAADVALTGGVNQCTIWAAFAKRGLGASASQGSSGSRSDGTAAFDIPTGCSFLGTPLAQDICQSQNAVFPIQVGAAFTTPVSMSALGNPAGTTAIFNPNPVTGTPTTTVLTIGNTGSVPPGTYAMTVLGNNVTTQSITATLNVFAGVSGAPTLTAPANGASSVSLNPTLTWQATPNTSSYLVQVATDAAFGNVVFSTTTATTSTVVSTQLNAATEYFWRVRASNPCGSGSFAPAFSFTTVMLYCVSPNLAIPDNNVVGVTSTLTITAPGTLADLNVIISGTHTWVGDLVFTLRRNTVLSSTVIDRPGVPSSTNGCANNNFNVTLDDEGASGPVENQCAAASPALFGNPTPNNPLNVFDGSALAGTWTLNVSDRVSTDTGVVQQWCLAPGLATSYGMVMAPTAPSLNGNPGTLVTHTVRLTNTGSASDSFTLTMVSSAFSATLPLTVGPVNAGSSLLFDVGVAIPANAAPGGPNATQLRARSMGDPGILAATTLNTVVNTVSGGQANPPAAASANPGALVTYTVRVTNTGNATDSFTPTVSGNAFAVAVPPTTGPLAPNAAVNLVVSVTVPANALAGTTDVADLLFTSANNPATTFGASLSTTVNAVYGVQASPVSPNAQSAYANTTVTYTVRVTNTSNVTETFAMGWVATPTFPTSLPATLGPLAPGASALVTVTVNVPLSATFGQNDVATFYCTAMNAPSATTNVTMATTALWYRLFLPLLAR